MRLILIALMLAGCATQEQRLARDQARCEGYGFQWGTDAFANCMYDINRQRDAAMLSTGQYLLNQGQPRALAPPPDPSPRSVNCTTYRMPNGQTQVNCF